MNRNQKVSALLVTLLSIVTTQANAALDTNAAAAFTSLTTAGTDYVAAAWGVAVVVVVGFAGIKLFKKSVSRAT